MPTRVDIGNGYIAEFPDGMSKDAIRSALIAKGPKMGGAAPQTAPGPTANTREDSEARGLPPLTMPNWLGQELPAPRKAPPLSQQWQGVKDMAVNAPVGAAGAIAGLPGNIEGLGRAALGRVADVSQRPMLPTTPDVENAIAGPADTEGKQAGRAVGNLFGPPAVAGTAQKAGAGARALVRGGAPSQAAQDARAAGYAIPPNMAQEKPSIVSQGLSAWGGKIKTQQAASTKNQQITNAIAAKELGVAPNVPLTKQTFEGIRDQAGKAYGAVSQAMPETIVDPAFTMAIRQIGGRAQKVAQEFPELASNKEVQKIIKSLGGKQKFSTEAAIQLVRRLRADASSHLKAFDDPAKKALGGAQREAADLVEDLIERGLTQQGNATLMQQYRQARQLIAKSHDVEAATNLATGEVSARDLARMADKGRPLTGGLSAIAKMGGAFPKAAQDVSAFGGAESVGVLDVAGGALSAGLGRPEILAALLARPAARGTILSNPYQNAVLGARNAPVPGGAPSVSPTTMGLLAPGVLNRLLTQEPR